MENASISSDLGNAGSFEQRSETAPVMSVKDWVITSIIAAIPLVGFIMLFVWAFGDGTNPNKANWAKAALLIAVIFFIFGVLMFMIFGGLAFLSTANNY